MYEKGRKKPEVLQAEKPCKDNDMLFFEGKTALNQRLFAQRKNRNLQKEGTDDAFSLKNISRNINNINLIFMEESGGEKKKEGGKTERGILKNGRSKMKKRRFKNDDRTYLFFKEKEEINFCEAGKVTDRYLSKFR